MYIKHFLVMKATISPLRALKHAKKGVTEHDNEKRKLVISDIPRTHRIAPLITN